MSVLLSEGKVEHWSTSVYGRRGSGHISAWQQAGGTVMLNINTPGKKPGSTTIGGPRRIDITLTPQQVRDLIKELQATLK